jgi:hypothetical protein
MKKLLLLLVALLLSISAYAEEANQIQLRVSEVENVPLPDEAESIPFSTELLMEGYRVPEMSFDALEAWYEEHLPVGQAWMDWTWCEYKDRESFTQRTYHRPDTAEILTIVLLRQEPPEMLISFGENEPC